MNEQLYLYYRKLCYGTGIDVNAWKKYTATKWEKQMFKDYDHFCLHNQHIGVILLEY